LIRVVRVPILLGGALGYCLGVLLGLDAGGILSLPLAAVCYLVAALGDLSTHYSNDYYDVELDRLAPRKTFGGSNLLVSRGELKRGALFSAEVLSLASIILSFFAVSLGAPLLLVPLAVGANFLGWLYSTLVRLSHRGLGEAAIAVGTGFGVPVAGYLAVTGAVDAHFLLISAAFMLYGFVLSLSLELPDLEADRVGGKMNLVARYGSRFCLRLALLLCLGSEVILTLFAGAGMALAGLVPLLVVIWGNLAATDEKSRLDAVSATCILSLFVFLVVSIGSLAFF